MGLWVKVNISYFLHFPNFINYVLHIGLISRKMKI